MAKSTVFKIVSGIAVVSVVVVLALALAGVFTPNTNSGSPVVAIAEESSQTQFLGDITADHVFVIKGSKAIADINSNVTIRGNNENVVLVKSVIDADNFIYGVTAEGGFIPGLAYTITLYGANFADEAYAGLTSLVFRVVKDESEVMALATSSILFAEDEVEISIDSGTETILTVLGKAGASYLGGTVFLIGDIVNGVAYKAIRDSQADGNNELVYVEDAEIEDVFDDIDIFKTYEISEDNVLFDEEASIQSIMESDFFLDAYELLFGKKIVDTKNIKLAFDVKFTTSKIDVKLELVFRNFIPGDVDWEIALVVNNSITPEPTLNFQKDPKAFDFTVDMDIVTTAKIDFKVGKKLEYYNNVNKLMNSMADLSKEGSNLDRGMTFFTWIIPLGPLPICIEYSMGAALRFEFAGQIGFEVTNTFSATFGIVYVNDEITTFNNHNNKFELGNLALSGKVGAKVGITNSIDISAYGVVSIGLVAEVGVYADLAGRIAVNIGKLVDEKKFNFVPAYDLETGIYLDIDLAAKLFKINIKKVNVLAKKWPLYNLGYKYIPVEFTEGDETIYMSGTYAYLSSFAATAFNLHKLSNEEKPIGVKYNQFDYDLTDAPNITLVGNKIEVKPSVTGRFEDVIVVTSKINKDVTKRLIIKKMAEAPSAEIDTIDYDKATGGAASFDVLLNTSKFIGLIGDVAINNAEYSMKGSNLTISASYMNKLNYGKYGFVFESSKGNINLYVNVMSSEAIAATNNYVEFDMLSPTNALFKIDLKGNSIANIQGVLPSYYTYQTATGSLCIYGSYLLTLDAGEKDFTVNYSNGSSEVLTVNIIDSRMPKLATTAYEFMTSSSRKVEVAMTLYSATFEGVTCNGKTLSLTEGRQQGDVLILSDTYLKGLGEGVHTFSITTSQNTLEFTVNVSASITAVIPVKSATFDKAELKDVVFEVITESNNELTLTGGDVEYVYNKGQGFVIDANYLNGLAVGLHTFAVGGANFTTSLNVEVINTKEPSIVAGDYAFDKADPKDVDVTLSLEEAVLESIDGLNSADWSYANGKLTIYKEALSAKAYGLQSFAINTSVSGFDIVVSIEDSRHPVAISNTSITFNKVNGNPLSVTIELYGKKFVSINTVAGEELRAVNYRYADGVVSFANDFVYGLKDGNYEYIIKTSDPLGDITLYVGVEGSSKLKLDTIGDGTANNPYQIFTKSQMEEFAKEGKKKDFSGQYFMLNSDIDWGYSEISPIGSKDKAFRGVFNGNGYTIKNITIKGVKDDYTGFFAYNAGTIKNLNFSEAKLEFADHGSIGAGIVVGKNSGTIEDVKVFGSIKAESKSWLDLMNAYFDIGGLVGYNSGTIKDVDVTINIEASVKGLSVMGIKLFGKKSNINVGSVVGYLAEGSVAQNAESNGYIKATATSNKISHNGWYGESDNASGSGGRYRGLFE